MKTKITKLVTTDLDEWAVGEDGVDRIWSDAESYIIEVEAWRRGPEGALIQMRYVLGKHAVKMTVQEANHGRAR